jgi:hypothetical protein
VDRVEGPRKRARADAQSSANIRNANFVRRRCVRHGNGPIDNVLIVRRSTRRGVKPAIHAAILIKATQARYCP